MDTTLADYNRFGQTLQGYRDTFRASVSLGIDQLNALQGQARLMNEAGIKESIVPQRDAILQATLTRLQSSAQSAWDTADRAVVSAREKLQQAAKESDFKTNWDKVGYFTKQYTDRVQVAAQNEADMRGGAAMKANRETGAQLLADVGADPERARALWMVADQASRNDQTLPTKIDTAFRDGSLEQIYLGANVVEARAQEAQHRSELSAVNLALRSVAEEVYTAGNAAVGGRDGRSIDIGREVGLFAQTAIGGPLQGGRGGDVLTGGGAQPWRGTVANEPALVTA